MARYTRKFFFLFILMLGAISSKALTASFTADYVSGCSPLVVHFTNTSTGATSYSWNLGNGTTSTLTNASGSYITAGTYTVTLTAISGSSTVVQTLTITVYPSPIVSFYASDTTLCPGAATTFTSTSVVGTSGTVSYLWSFGDGSSSTLAGPTHNYTAAGFYNVTLLVTNGMGCTTSYTHAAYIQVTTPPSVAFGTSSGAYYCSAPASVAFTNSSSGAGTLSYLWSFGDGTTSVSAAPTHTYGSLGSYNVRLIVTDANGCVDSVSRTSYINVTTTTTSFTFSAVGCSRHAITFTNTSSAHTRTYWSYGDGGTDTTNTGVHVYTSPGTYSVRLVIFNGYCYDTAYNSVVILAPPSASFSYSPLHPCPPPSAITFTATAPTGSTINWNFGDGTSSTGTSTTVMHTYTSPGIYVAGMTVTDINGCTAYISDSVRIYDLKIDISSDAPFGGCVPLTVSFIGTPQTHIPGPIAVTYPYAASSYRWDFGDGSAPTSTVSPSHTYTAVGVYSVLCTVNTVNSCSRTDTIIVRVGTPPVVHFYVSPARVCFGHSYTCFAVVDSGTVDQFIWDFGDGSSATSTTTNILHVNSLPGVDTIELIGYFNGCPSAPYYVYNVTTDSPDARIEGRINCSGSTVIYIDSSLGDDSHIWLFGDGTTSTADSVVHSYATTGSYICTLATYNSRSGCRDTATFPVRMASAAIGLVASDSSVCAGTPITLTPIADTTTLSYYWYTRRTTSGPWSLVDNDTGSVFTGTFDTAGLYSVRLIILDGRSCPDTAEVDSWLYVSRPSDSFAAVPFSGCGPLAVLFNDHSTDIATASITNYAWSFGDGTTATMGTGTVSHLYTATGTYSVKEVVTDNYGCKDSLSRAAYINVWRPRAAFATTSYFPCIGNLVSFVNSSLYSTGSYWLFGDGDTSAVLSPSHVYTAVGTYTVKLVASDAHGCRDTSTLAAPVTVTQPTAAFTESDSFTICPPLTVRFFNGSTGATSYSWTFGDGGRSVLASPSNLYIAPGLYNVKLIVGNTHGCADTAYGHVTLYGYAGAFSYFPLTGCAPLTVHFGAALSNVPNIIWDFADGSVSSASYADSTIHTYTAPGAYVPKLILSDNSGCQNSSLGLDTIKVDAVIPDFTTRPNPICINTNVTYVDSSKSYFSTVTNWSWQFGVGDSSLLSAPVEFYTVTGTFPIKLTATDAWGCVGSFVKNVQVYPPPTITTSPDTTICLTDSATLQAYGGATYTWAPIATVSCPTCQTTKANPIVQTVYTVTGIDAHGCSSTDTVNVYLRTNTVSHAWGDAEICRNTQVQLNDTGGTKYQWIPSSGLSNASIGNPLASPYYSTKYMIIARYGSCIPDTNYVTITVHPVPTVDAGPTQMIVAGTPANLLATGSNIATYQWLPAQTLSCATCAATVASLTNSEIFTVTVSSSFGCKASDTVSVLLFCDKSQVFIPTAFTPNGDGENDVFYPRGTGIKHINTFRIYNRWGNLVFEKTNFMANDVSHAWDGSYGGVPPRPDVYVYFLDAVCDTGEPLFIKGDVTIIN